MAPEELCGAATGVRWSLALVALAAAAARSGNVEAACCPPAGPERDRSFFIAHGAQPATVCGPLTISRLSAPLASGGAAGPATKAPTDLPDQQSAEIALSGANFATADSWIT